MRPLRLELQGFTAFREPVAIDFTDADVFALVGPTGAGKSSVIDAICFALYGIVPRYDDRRLVAPVISQGKVEARVSLTFAVGDDTYTAVRVVRRTPAGGATTKEARLQREGTGEVVAGDADGVSAAVERLLGLRWEHFITCVALPQGDFARFLHGKPRDRQDLLVTLLDLGVYDRVGRLARERAAAHRVRVDLLDERLRSLEGATPAARAAAADRVAALEALRERIEADDHAIEALRTAADDARRAAADALSRLDVLAALTVPAGVGELADALAAVAAAVDGHRVAESAAAEAVDAADKALAALPPRSELVRLVELRDERSEAAALEAKGAAALAAAVAEETDAATDAQRAEDARRQALVARDAVAVAHRAAELAADLRAGQPCPVCQQVVSVVPGRTVPGDLAAAVRAVEAAERASTLAADRHRQAELRRSRVEEKLAGVRARLTELDARLAEAPSADAVEAHLAEVAAAEQAAADARAASRRASEQRVAAERARHQLAEQEVAAWASFDAARDRLATLSPPAADRADLARAWGGLVEWADGAVPGLRAAVEAAGERAARADAARRDLVDAHGAACATAGVDVASRTPRDACVEALARAGADLTRLDDALAEADRLRAERARLDEAASVAEELGRHLGAKGFEKWLLDEALVGLVAGATEILHELSGGLYSLALDPKSSAFMVVDHRNADELRPARTLSGGETFLASLALALALADRVAGLAAHGAARLDAIFLDEGFGSLDPETLDTVAVAIEELGSRGRMVGLISHVAELAERVPVRFEVRRGPSTSTVERASS